MNAFSALNTDIGSRALVVGPESSPLSQIALVVLSCGGAYGLPRRGEGAVAPVAVGDGSADLGERLSEAIARARNAGAPVVVIDSVASEEETKGRDTCGIGAAHLPAEALRDCRSEQIDLREPRPRHKLQRRLTRDHRHR